MRAAVPLHLILAVAMAPAAVVARQPADCRPWQACRDLVEEALAAGQYERAHDLAWRAVQLGPRDDAALMFLLARAQSRAGRPQDALVMVRRLAERGVSTAALDHPDLARARDLPAWADMEELVRRANERPAAVESAAPPGAARVATPGAPGSRGTARPPSSAPASDATRDRESPARATSASASAPPAPPAANAPRPAGPAEADATGVIEREAAVEDFLRFAVDPFVAGGVAYDAVSHRFVFGDRHGRKLRVVGEGLDEAVDLVRAESAGFSDVRALDIDTRRGDLWVASADAAGDTAALHRVQLISGRPLQRLPIPRGDGPAVHPVDLAVGPGGDVFVLDGNGRTWRAGAGGASIAPAFVVSVTGATSLAISRSGAVAYVSHEGGIMSVDLATGTAVPLTAPADVRLAGFERLRPHRDGLVGLQADADGARRVVRLALAANGRGARTATVFDARFDGSDGPVGFAVSGDDVSVITGLAPEPGVASPGGAMQVVPVVRRLRLP